MGIQDRDYYWEHRDRQEGRAKPRSGPDRAQAPPHHQAATPDDPGEGISLISRGPRKRLSPRHTRRPAPMWLIILAMAFVLLMASFVMHLMLRFLR